MAKSVKFEVNISGLNELRNSAEIAAVVEAAAREVAGAAEAESGDDYNVTVRPKPTRVVAAVTPANSKAYYRNREHNYLGEALKGKVGK